MDGHAFAGRGAGSGNLGPFKSNFTAGGNEALEMAGGLFQVAGVDFFAPRPPINSLKGTGLFSVILNEIENNQTNICISELLFLPCGVALKVGRLLIGAEVAISASGG